MKNLQFNSENTSFFHKENFLLKSPITIREFYNETSLWKCIKNITKIIFIYHQSNFILSESLNLNNIYFEVFFFSIFLHIFFKKKNIYFHRNSVKNTI